MIPANIGQSQVDLQSEAQHEMDEQTVTSLSIHKLKKDLPASCSYETT